MRTIILRNSIKRFIIPISVICLAMLLTLTFLASYLISRRNDSMSLDKKVLSAQIEKEDKVNSLPPMIAEPDLISQQLDQLTLEEKVGQMFMGGAAKEDRLDIQIELIKEKHFGGILLMRVNLTDPVKTKDSLSKLVSEDNGTKPPLLIAVDEEGGVVTRLSNQLTDQTAQPDLNSDQLTYDTANRRAKELDELGFNVNFAPVIDYIPTPGSFLYDRTFRGDRDKVAILGASMIQGYRDHGIIASPKHYPGHPSTLIDSHLSLPTSDISQVELKGYTEQFQKVIDLSDPMMIMTGHVMFPNIDPVHPSTLSEIIIRKHLRETLGYDGVVITDDMQMGAIRENFTFQESILLAVNAGNDILLYVTEPNFQSDAYDILLNSVKNGTITEERIDESVYRILRMKSTLR